MNTIKLIIFSILVIIWIIAYYKLGHRLNNKIDSFIYFALFALISAIFILLTFITTSLNDRLSEENKNKCPELEEVKGIYKIK